MPVWLEVVLVWMILGSVLNIIGFRKYYWKFVQKIDNIKGYEEGYRDGVWDTENRSTRNIINKY